MDAKLEAKRLIEKFYPYSDGYRNYDIDEYYQLENAKQCALICIDEVMEVSDDSNEYRFLEQIKKEIEAS